MEYCMALLHLPGIHAFPIPWVHPSSLRGSDWSAGGVALDPLHIRHNWMLVLVCLFPLQDVYWIPRGKVAEIRLLQRLVQLHRDICTADYTVIFHADSAPTAWKWRWGCWELETVAQNCQHLPNFPHEFPTTVFNQDFWFLCTFCQISHRDLDRHGPDRKCPAICGWSLRSYVLCIGHEHGVTCLPRWWCSWSGLPTNQLI